MEQAVFNRETHNMTKNALYLQRLVDVLEQLGKYEGTCAYPEDASRGELRDYDEMIADENTERLGWVTDDVKEFLQAVAYRQHLLNSLLNKENISHDVLAGALSDAEMEEKLKEIEDWVRSRGEEDEAPHD